MKYDCKPLKNFKHNQRVYVPSAQMFGIIKHRYNKIVIVFDNFSVENSPNWCGAISEETYELVQLQQENERLKKEKQELIELVNQGIETVSGWEDEDLYRGKLEVYTELLNKLEGKEWKKYINLKEPKNK